MPSEYYRKMTGHLTTAAADVPEDLACPSSSSTRIETAQPLHKSAEYTPVFSKRCQNPFSGKP